MTSDSLQGSALNASRAALAAALADSENKGGQASTGDEQTPNDREPGETGGGDLGDGDGEVQEVNMESQAEEIRTVFNDPQRFNVKARSFFLPIPSLVLNPLPPDQHPLYSSWTLWFDSPATKGRNLPQTPSASFPQTPSTPTPAAAATGGWMDDIKRVISFDSVEEFWG
jgi:translation initiation factor 4E